MYYSVLILVVFARSAQSKLVYDDECIKIHNKTLDNSYLLGTWHDVMELKPGPAPSFYHCFITNYTTVTQDEILEFKKKYINAELPFSFDTNPVKYSYDNTKQFGGLIFGDKEVKFFLLDSKRTRLTVEKGIDKPYLTIVHKKIDDNFALRFRCAFSEHFVYLMSKKRHPTDEEMNAAVDTLPKELKILQRHKRRCAPLA